MANIKTGVLLINLGTTDSPATKDVRSYLTEFLNDPRVIDINAVGRTVLVNGAIVPFRAPKSAKIYQNLWELWGGKSPLLTYGEKLKEEVQKTFSKEDNVTVEFAMRYKNPSLKSVLNTMQKAAYDQIIILPLFPHYASSSTGSAVEKTMQIIGKWWAIPTLKVISNFFDNTGYIDAFIARANEQDVQSYDHVLFSYHGLPERQIDKVHPSIKCNSCDCDKEFKSDQRLCYRNACYETTRLIAKGLNLPENKHSVAFQSRLGKTPWIQPYADQEIAKLAKGGKKNILVFSAAFIADCLETSVEIGIEFQEIFKENGGDKVQLVKSLNDSEIWVNAVKKMLIEHL